MNKIEVQEINSEGIFSKKTHKSTNNRLARKCCLVVIEDSKRYVYSYS